MLKVCLLRSCYFTVILEVLVKFFFFPFSKMTEVSKAKETTVNQLESSITTKREATPVATAFNILKTIVGAGIFATSTALDDSGFYFGMLLIILMTGLFYFTLITMVRASLKSNVETAQDLMLYCFGKFGEISLNITVFCIAWGCIMAYTVIIGDVLPDVLQNLVGPQSSPFLSFLVSRQGMVLLVSVFILFPVSCSKNLAGLAKFSGFALSAILFIVISIISIAPTLPDEYKGAQTTLSIIHVSGISSAIATFSFCYVCHHNILLNFNAMKGKSIKTFSRVVAAVLTIAMILTMAVGCAYVTFRDKSKTNILNSFPKDNVLIIICRILFAIDMLFTYPLELFVARDTIQKSFFKNKQDTNIRHYLLTFLILSSTVVIGCLTDNLGLIIDLVGGCCAAIIAFVVPSACFLRVLVIQEQKISIFTWMTHGFVILFGLALLVLTLVVTIVG